MNDTAGRDDDVDDVTLWAGRLRAWPLPPSADAEGEETVPSQRAARVDRGSAIAAGDDTIRPRAAARHVARDETDPDVTAVDDTVRPRAAARRAARDETEPDVTAVDDTVAATTGGEITVESAARADAPATGERAETLPAAPFVDADVADADDVEQDTAAGFRRPRDDLRAPAAGEGALREARVPTALGRETYSPRVDAPVRVTRAAPGPVRSTTDAAAPTARRARGGGGVILLGVVIVVVAVLAVVGVALLVG